MNLFTNQSPFLEASRTVPDKSSGSVTFIQTFNLEPKYTNYRTTVFFVFQVLIHGSHIIVSRLSMDVDVQILTNPSLNSGQASKARYQVNRKYNTKSHSKSILF